MLRRWETMRSRMSGALDLAQLEHKRVADVLLLDRRLADEELPRLAVVIGEALRTQPHLGPVRFFLKGAEAARGILARAAVGPRCSARS